MSKKKTKHLNKEKAKKEKIVYVDDGSTIVDMSGTINAPKKPKNQPKDPVTGSPILFMGLFLQYEYIIYHPAV